MDSKRFALCIALFIWGFGPIRGQQWNDQQKDSLLTLEQKKLDEIIINAPVYIQKLESWSGAVSIIDSMQIRSGNSYQLSEQINTIPGVVMQQGTMSTNRITIRGVGSRTAYESNRIKAYWGEMPLTNGDGVTSIEDISLNDIGGIQVLKGPSSALFGAGLGGVIFIDPWNAVNNNEVYFKSEMGSYNTISNQLNVSFKNATSGIYSITAGQLHTDGYRENSNYNRYTVTLKGRQPVGKNYLHFLYNYRYLNGQIPSSLDSTDFNDNPKKAARSWKNIQGYEKTGRHLINLGFSSPFSKNTSNVINMFYNNSNLDELRPFNRLDEQRTGLGMREKFTFTKNNLRIDLGGELMWEQNQLAYYGVDSDNKDDLLNSNNISRSYVNVFVLFEYQFHPKWTLQAAANVNQTFYTSEDDGTGVKYDHRYDWIASPRIGLNYNFYKQMYLYGSFGHGFSTPSVEEAQMPDASFNRDIKPEEGWNADFGYRFHSDNAKTRIDLTFYWMRLSNLLVTKRESEAVFYGVNAGETTHNGLELTANKSFFEIKDKRQLDVSVAYFTSVNKFKNFIDDGDDYSGNHLPGIPNYSFSIDGHLYIKPFHINVNYKAVGSQYLNDSNLKEYESYAKAGSRILIDVVSEPFKGSVYLGADNLFNTHYASMVLINAPSFGNNAPRYYYPGLPFTIYAGFNLSF
ncbi:TonB-dependent receptor [Carboxylicivirga linearis]|uniref:TonB-dependent receptor n=1 Tax=Carboxylicivirga linearis TaxID=1628157 RepID=A0ABS5JU21_9BACT|nr:TonB-dependent receptor [Carboxylicivirga linearis]MBS2098318.1 TonB-dependent receptor [Carboxylicivirga linearis]